jgi:hypothetical protein
MRYRSLAPLLAFVASCGPDPEPIECHGGPDFSVLITAPDGPLPPETVVKLYYGGRAPADPEILTVAAPATPQALFCYVSDKNVSATNGVYESTGPALGSKATPATYSNGGAGGETGAGGAGGADDGTLEALVCNLYTDGSARLEVVTASYELTSLDLALKKGVCTVSGSLVLEIGDAGM